MPIYTVKCSQKHRSKQYRSVRDFEQVWICHCGLAAWPIITAPILVTATPEVCYDSPIDGRPITSQAAREEDLARHHCVPYDPDIRQDYERRIVEGTTRLEKEVGETIEASIEKLPMKQRGELYSELTEQGKTVEYVRSSLDGKQV